MVATGFGQCAMLTKVVRERARARERERLVGSAQC